MADSLQSDCKLYFILFVLLLLIRLDELLSFFKAMQEVQCLLLDSSLL